jgi:hypothetical protein
MTGGARPCENRALARPPGAHIRPPATRHLPAAPRPRSNMDIERINAIGKSIADLTERTTALRGYL